MLITGIPTIENKFRSADTRRSTQDPLASIVAGHHQQQLLEQPDVPAPMLSKLCAIETSAA